MACRRAVGLVLRRGTCAYSTGIYRSFRHCSALDESPVEQQQHRFGSFLEANFSVPFPRHASFLSIGRSDGSQGIIKEEEVSGDCVRKASDPNPGTDKIGQEFGADPLYGEPEVLQVAVTDSNDAGVSEVTSGGIWSVLRAPADGVVVLVDGLHTLTGASWWLTIICSTLAFRAAVFPFTILYTRKSAQFMSSLSLLPPVKPAKESGKSFSEQYRIFTEKRIQLGVPSPAWLTAGFLQAPLFLYWIVALRGMAMNHHPGFETGGALWFVDLTVPVHGALGALFPSLMALTYFANIQVSFRKIKPSNDLRGFFMKIYQWWLEAITFPLFIMGFYLPQGVFMYWLTNNCFNLAQTIAFQHDGVRRKLGLPKLPELNTLKAKQAHPTSANNVDSEAHNVDVVLSSAMNFAIQGRKDEAMKLLEFLLKKYPDESEPYNMYGWLLLKEKQWAEAIEYYYLAISKAKDDAPRITAFMGAGICLYNQGRSREAIDLMRPLVDFKVPQEPEIRQKYLRSLVTLSSVLSQEGLKREALSVLELAVKWDGSILPYIQKLRRELESP